MTQPASPSIAGIGATQAPPADAFPTYPASWYLFGETREVDHGPVTKEMLGRQLVGFRTAGGRLGLLDARCSHLRANLGNGCVVGDTIQCPYHHWRYAVTGRCVHIPSVADIPDFARQRAYPVVERHGLVFFFNGPEPQFPLPFFAGAQPEEFVRASPFGLVLDCPWWMVGANACDVQHFLGAHDRKLDGPPRVDQPAPYARRASAPFRVVGASLRDRVTRWFGGDVVEMSITDWCGTLMFVTATFRRTRSHGMLTSIPLGRDRVLVRGIVFVHRSRNALRRRLFDPVHLWVRRHFIKEFLRPDAELATRGLRYQPGSLLPCDVELARYFAWLAETAARTSAASAGAAWTDG